MKLKHSKNILVCLMMQLFFIQMQAVTDLSLKNPQPSSMSEVFHYKELSLGLLVGALAVLVVHRYCNPSDDQEFDEQVNPIKPKKEKSSTVFTYDQRLSFLKKAFLRCDTTFIDFDLIASMTGGFSRGHLERFVKIVIRSATEYHIDFLEQQNKSGQITTLHPVTMSMIRLALDEMHGGSKNCFQGDDEDRMQTALHEAGHALAIIEHQNYLLNFVSTINRENSGGRNICSRSFRAEYQGLQDCQHKIVVCLCGGVAEQMFGFDKAWYRKRSWVYETYHTRAKISQGLIDLLSRSSVKDDVRQAREMAVYMIENKMIELTHFDHHGQIDMELEIEYILEDCYQKAVAFLAMRKADMKKIANILLTKDIVCGSEIYALFQL
jgi:ATP-dependent Zn protease